MKTLQNISKALGIGLAAPLILPIALFLGVRYLFNRNSAPKFIVIASIAVVLIANLAFGLGYGLSLVLGLVGLSFWLTLFGVYFATWAILGATIYNYND